MAYPFGPLYKLMLLTGQRRGEVAAMKWSQIGDDGWRLPAASAKTKVGHLVPLSTLSREVLDGVPEIGEYVFRADRADAPLQGWSGRSAASTGWSLSTSHGKWRTRGALPPRICGRSASTAWSSTNIEPRRWRRHPGLRPLGGRPREGHGPRTLGQQVARDNRHDATGRQRCAVQGEGGIMSKSSTARSQKKRQIGKLEKNGGCVIEWVAVADRKGLGGVLDQPWLPNSRRCSF